MGIDSERSENLSCIVFYVPRDKQLVALQCDLKNKQAKREKTACLFFLKWKENLFVFDVANSISYLLEVIQGRKTQAKVNISKLSIMFMEEQRNRKPDASTTTENEVLEKKQRVEQLVTALSKGERKTSYSSDTENNKIVRIALLNCSKIFISLFLPFFCCCSNSIVIRNCLFKNFFFQEHCPRNLSNVLFS